MVFLQSFLSLFHFIARARLRRFERARIEREHQLALITQVTRALEVLVEGQSTQTASQTAAFIEIAKSNVAQAEAFSTWIKSFQITSAPTTSVVTEEDEFNTEQQRIADQLGLDPADLESLPAEFRLALSMKQQEFLDDVRSDTKA